MRFTCPGKVFLLGEYSVLEGGPSIVGAVGPLFELSATKVGIENNFDLPFAPQSPAGLYLTRHKNLIQDYHLQWKDPYSTAIGVGSSSAQFILSMALIHKIQNKGLLCAQDVLETYWGTVGATQGLRPSGADVVAQFSGGFNLFRNQPFHCESLPRWQSDVAFILAFTGSKAKTHEHLQYLMSQGFPSQYLELLHQLDRMTLKAIEFWRQQRIVDFGACLNEFQKTLNLKIPSSEHYRSQIDDIQKWNGVIGAKGSGAQGGDCVLILVQRNEAAAIQDRIIRWGWMPYSVEWSEQGLTGL